MAQSVIVLGASGGIGQFVASALVSAGYKVLAADLEVPNIQGAEGQICDVTDSDSLARLVEKANADGDLWGLVYVSGIIHPATPIEDFSIETWDKVFDVNIKGVVRMAHHAVPVLKSNGGGSIVTISSWWGHSGHAFFAGYGASKAALISLTQSMAEELAPDNIRVNSIAPGNIDTEMHRDALATEAKKRGISFEEMKEIEWQKIPMKMAGPPQAIADAVVFLLSGQSGYIAGATIDVNGGVLLR